MLWHSLDLTGVLWVAQHVDGTEVHKGPQINGVKKYELIDRTKLDTFSLTWRNKPILSVHPKDRTLVARIKTWRSVSLQTAKTVGLNRFWIVALLAKPQSKESTQDIEVEYHPSMPHQFYKIDDNESSIHYLFENGKRQTNTKFGKLTPFTPLHLSPAEAKHLGGVVG